METPTLRIVSCSHQDGKTRMQGRDANHKPPEIAAWRNNLTALSQYRNLYFVACVDEIHVYEPQFPNQIVSREAVLIISIPASRPRLRGYIDYSKPQAANHVVVGDLGDEEVLLIACDSGDVVGYTTRSIAKAVAQQQTNSEGHSHAVPAAFFHENVGASAWGLDVHKVARLIAVSSNTTNIIVFAFALAIAYDDDPNEDGYKLSDTVSGDIRSQARDHKGSEISPLWTFPTCDDWGRDRNYHNFAISLTGHHTNIPYVSFLNTADDQLACPYLVSTDIEGKTILWNVWTREKCLLNSIGEPFICNTHLK